MLESEVGFGIQSAHYEHAVDLCICVTVFSLSLTHTHKMTGLIHEMSAKPW